MREVYIDTIGAETRRLVVEDGRPVELAYAYRGEAPLTGGLYLGRVLKVLKGMHAAFVDIGLEKNAFLSLDDLPPALRDTAMPPQVQPGKAIKGGMEIIVQVVKEPGGDKGPRVTMNPSLPGQYVVLLPTVVAMGVSRHIQDVQEREALEEAGRALCPEGMGLVLRTAAQGVPRAEIQADIQALGERWDKLVQASATIQAPALLYSETDLAGQAARDLGCEAVLGPFPQTMEAALEKELRRKVWLPSGAYLLFDRTEALTVIDVNSGKYTGKRNLDETLLHLNLEAAKEIARQLRLRDIGGIVLVDFVDMAREEDRVMVMDALREALKADRAKHHIHGFTMAGLLEMTRRPVYQPLAQATQSECPCCGGIGLVRRPIVIAHEILRGVRRKRAGGDASVLHIAVSCEVARELRQSGYDMRDIVLTEKKGEAE